MALLCAVLGLYVAGYALLYSLNLNPREATPLTVIRYAYYLGDRPEVATRVRHCLLGSVLLMSVTGAAVCWPRPRALHGEARFARRGEIARAGLLGETGIILGEFGRRYLMLAGQQGAILAAPPRSGKGVGIVVPNLLNWPHSLVCTDVKHENWHLTAGYRASRGQQCHLFDPLNKEGRTARCNPFTYVSSDPALRVNDLQLIADMIYPEVPGTDPFWTASARSLFSGIALYLFETPSLPTTIGEVLRQGMASGEEGFGQHWKRLIEGRASGRYPLSASCVRALSDVIDLAPVTTSSIRKTFTSRLELWANPLIDAATSADDFDLRALRTRPMSIYVGVNPADLHRLRPLLSLFFQQALGLQTRELPEHNPKLKYQVLMLLDEFTALGRIPIVAEAVSYLPGYNVRTVLVIQSPSQLREVYGANAAETITKSLAARIVFQPRDVADAKEISEELGNTTVKVRSWSRPRHAALSGKAAHGGSINMSEQRRALLLPQEVQHMGTDQAIVFYEKTRPIRCRKIRYFEDARFKTRLLPPPAVVAHRAPTTRVPPLPAAATEADGLSVSTPRQAPFEPCAPPASVIRTVTADDVERWDELTLKDFAADFSAVQLPQSAATDKDLSQAVDQFLDSLRR